MFAYDGRDDWDEPRKRDGLRPNRDLKMFNPGSQLIYPESMIEHLKVI